MARKATSETKGGKASKGTPKHKATPSATPPSKGRKAATEAKATGKPKPPPAPHKRRALLAWMRDDPRRALRYVARAWFDRASHYGEHDAAPMAEVLAALSEAEATALRERNGPLPWARRQRSKAEGAVRIRSNRRDVTLPDLDSRILALPRSKAEAGRNLVCWIEWWRRERPNASRQAFVQWILTIVAMDAPAAGWGPHRGTLDETDARTMAEVKKTEGRERHTADHLAIAVLVGWGLTRSNAKDAIKSA